MRHLYDRVVDFGWEQFDMAMYVFWELFPWIFGATVCAALFRLIVGFCG